MFTGLAYLGDPREIGGTVSDYVLCKLWGFVNDGVFPGHIINFVV